jgi:hypothetical protein
MTARTPSRRAVLTGAGGVTLGLPFLEITGGRAQAQAQPPPRLIIVSVGHSVQVQHGGESWLPGPDFTQLSPILQPLLPRQDKLLVLSGIDNLLASAGVVPSNGHNFSSRSLLTCMPTRSAIDGGGGLVSDPPGCEVGSAAGGPSFEYVVASAWKENVLNLRVGERPGEHSRSFRMDGSADEGNPSPVDAFDRLFNVKTPPTAGRAVSATPADRLRARRRSILDAVRSNFEGAMSRMGAGDRLRLENHANQIREFELGLEQVSRIVCSSPRLDPPRPLPSAFSQSEGRNDDVIAAAQVQLITTAFACQATRGAHLHFSNIQDNTFPWLAGGQDFIPGGWHQVVHLDQGSDDQRLRPMQWYMKVVADLLDRLEHTPEGAGTLADSTLVLWISSLRTGAHGTDNLPVLLAGSLGGKIKTGRHIRYRARTTGDLFTTLLATLDIPSSGFGWNQGSASGRAFINGPLAGWG